MKNALAFFLATAMATLCLSSSACETASLSRVERILEESIRLNNAFKNAARANDQVLYSSLRSKTETYDESEAIPCLRRAEALLSYAESQRLMKTLFAYAKAHIDAADETPSEVLANIFARHERLFEKTWRTSSVETRDAVRARVESGWRSVGSSYSESVRAHVEQRLKDMETK
jgi:hypothetical protein